MSQFRPGAFITDFFKPFSQPRHNKRFCLDDGIGHHRSTLPSELNTPVANSRTRHQRQLSSSPLSTGNRLDCLSQTPIRPEDDTLDETAPASFDIEHAQSPGLVPVNSQRVFRQAEVAITNSDDEPDTEGSLDDIDELLALRKPPVESSPPSESELPYTTPRKSIANDQNPSTQRKTRSSAVAKPSHLATAFPTTANYKFSMDLLIAQTREDEALEVGATKAREALEGIEQRRNAQSATENSDTNIRGVNISTKVIALAMTDRDDEEEGADRLMRAIRRTEALRRNSSWSFFDIKENAPVLEPMSFPLDTESPWPRSMKDNMFRQQAFLGGYAEEVASKKGLPEEIFMWITDSICTEPRHDLRHSYCQLLKDAASQVRHLLTPTCLDKLFQKLGASHEALGLEKHVVPTLHLRQGEGAIETSRLHTILDLLCGCAEYLNLHARIHAICLLCRLVLDSSIVNDCSLMVVVEEAFCNLVDAVPEENVEAELLVVSTTVYAFATDASLRLQLLRNIPASSSRLNIFRQRLALAYFFGNTAYLHKTQEDLLDLRSVAHHLRMPQFEIHNATDYAELAALTGALSIAIDDGDPPIPSSNPSAEADFNKKVDVLSHRVKSMFTSIVDTGASHMGRTEAKEVLESFHSCLLHAVRTRRKPKTMLFGDVDLNLGPQSKSALWLKSHLEKAKSGAIPISRVKTY